MDAWALTADLERPFGFSQWTPAEYGEWAVGYMRAMKQVDPSIRTGALIFEASDEWTDGVLEKVKNDADFLIAHIYPVGIWSEGTLAAQYTNRNVQAVVVAPQDLDEMFVRLRKHITRTTGRDIPLAITEYNGGFAQNKPLPYRFTLATALFVGDFRRVLLNPEHNILMANYWLMVDNFWGMIHTDWAKIHADARNVLLEGTYSACAWMKTAAFYVCRLWSRHCGPQQVAVTVKSPPDSFEGFLGVSERSKNDERGPFEPLTAFASLSADGRTLHLLVFNKHSVNDIETRIEIAGFNVSTAKLWQVNGTSLASFNEHGKPEAVTETRSGENIPLRPPGKITYVFPAHSMTAIDLSGR